MPASVTAYTLDSVNSNGCLGTVSGSATVNLAPTVSAVISGGGQICTGGNGTEIVITFTGTGPYTFAYTANNNPVATITTTTNPYIIPVNPNIGTIYRLDTVSNGTCGGMISGQAVVFVFTPPTANLSGSATFCDSVDTNVMIDFTGTGPFTVYYSINGVAQIPDTTQDDPYLIPIKTNITTTVTLDSIKSPGCDGIPSGSATITINYKPSYTNVNLNCNFAAGTYVVEFDVLGATTPLTLTSGSGSFSGTHFTSNAININTGYSFVFHDANNCGDVTVSGASTCNCTTDAGTMNLTPIETCVGSTATATHNNNFVNDGNDLLQFILHTNPALPIGTVLATSATPSFTFGPGMTAGTTYYISAIAGNNSGGNVDLNDLCLSVSQGTPVTFYPLPTANLANGDTICAGSQIQVPVSLTGVAPFSLTWALNGVQQPAVNNIPNSTYQISIQPLNTSVITLVAVGDSRCSTPVTDTATIVVNGPPQISNLVATCDGSTQTYVLTFTASGTPPFTVSGISGSFTGNQYTSLPIPWNISGAFVIGDANMCGQTSVPDTADCSCISNAGTMSQTPITACESQTLTVPVTTGQLLDADDQLLYILHTNAGNPPGIILAWSNTPQFTFQPGMLANTTYYVSAIAGNAGAPGQIDLGDPCLSIATGTPVQFQGLPTATLVTPDTTICPNKPLTFTVNFTGTPPFSLVYSYNNVNQPAVTNINSTAYTWTASFTQPTTVELESVSDQLCSSGTVQGTTKITLGTTPVITNVQTICNNTGQFYFVHFDIQNGTPPYNVTGITGTLTGNQFVSDSIPSGNSYSISLSDANLCGVTFIVGSYNCACTTKAGTLNQTPLNLCAGATATFSPVTGQVLDGNDALVYILATAPNPPAWTILATSPTPSFTFNPGTMSANTTYYIVAVAGNSAPGGGVDFTDQCLKIAAGPTVVWQAPVTATLTGPASVCAGVSTQLSVQFSGSAPYSFVYSNGTQQTVNTSQNPYTLTVTPSAGATSISLVSVTGAGCSGQASGSVAISAAPQALNVQAICDLNTQTYVLQFNIGNGAAPNPAYSVTGVQGTLTDTMFVSNPIPGDLPYNVTITNASGCSVSIAGESNCVCTTEAGTLTAVLDDACLPGGQVSVQVSGQVLEANDALQYILYQNAAQLPQGIIAVSNTPQFGFQAGMTAGTTYFVAAIAGNNNGSGAVDTSDACLAISPGIPVVFHNPPTAKLSDTISFCAGGNAAFQIKFTGTAPFKFVYAVNGNPQPQITAPGNTFSISTNNVQQPQTFTLVSVQDAFCTGTVSGQAMVTLIAPPTGSLVGDATICAGDTGTLALVLGGDADTFNVTIGGGPAPIQLNGVQNGATVSVAPAVNTTYTITALSANGNTCPAQIGPGATINVSSLSGTAQVSNYNGFGVSCPNGDDGSISVTPVGGIPEITANWNNNTSGTQLNNLAPGSYTVTLTDQIGCTWVDSFLLTAPPGLGIDVSAVSPTCYGDNDGSITVKSVMGGAKPFTLTLNGAAFSSVDTFPVTLGLLEAGDYLLEVSDANGCITEQPVTVIAPLQLTVDLGPDQTISFGDSLLLEALVNTTNYDTFIWTPIAFMKTPDSLVTMLRPTASQIYNIVVLDSAGCSARDEILVVVQKPHRVFLPNIIRPESIELNDYFTVFAGAEVSRIRTMQIYDRWGFGARAQRGLGLSALFCGTSGTGKTLAAEVLAHDLCLDLYRIDLSQVVSKYIGETEKNLRRVFDAAEQGGAVLLFDEADALFGKRSEVKDSHDRYANIEVSYLLQRMEAYTGLSVLTSNQRSAIDPAFLRRLRFVLAFPFPDEAQRDAIWRRQLPAAMPRQGIDTAQLARLRLTGGQIRNIALNAAFLAADDGGRPVTMAHLAHAVQLEAAKHERSDLQTRGWVA